jgi:hypothetical protein
MLLATATTGARARTALAEPQGHVALRTAVCGAGGERGLWRRTLWCNGLTGDLLFLRHRNRDFGLGPYLELSTAGLWDLRWGGGGTVLLPLTENFPLLLSLGMYGHRARTLAAGGTLFFGLRSYNFEGTYNAALGMYVSAYRDLGTDHASLVSAGLELDALLVGAPFLFGWAALR